MNHSELVKFCTPFYAEKDIMHDLWHIELVERWADRIIALGNYQIDHCALLCAAWFHGFIYSHEPLIREWLAGQGCEAGQIEKIIRIAWESQRPEIPETLEGKILHDAHVLEGGKTYMVVKTLITGSVRGQTLKETLDYLKSNVIDHNFCYLPETISLCAEMNEYSKEFVRALEEGINPSTGAPHESH